MAGSEPKAVGTVRHALGGGARFEVRGPSNQSMLVNRDGCASGRRLRGVCLSSIVHRLGAAFSALESTGVVVVDDAFGASVAQHVKSDVIALYDANLFCPAGVGAAKVRRKEVRSDELLWVLPSVDGVDFELPRYLGIAELVRSLDVIGKDFSQRAFVHLNRLEVMLTHYPPGGFYVPHRDRVAGTSERLFTFVYFLNHQWTDDDGGQLRLLGPHAQTVAPIADRLILFHTPDVEHEVLVTRASRFAVTGWFGRRT